MSSDLCPAALCPLIPANMHFLETFIPLFVAIDPLGLLPVFLSLTATLQLPRRRAVTYEAAISALTISLTFMFLGNLIFRFLSISVARLSDRRWSDFCWSLR